MDKLKAAQDIIHAALPLVPFEGWNQQSLGKAAQNAGYRKTDAIRVFPGGAIEAVDFYMQMTDAAMVESLAGYHLDTMKIRERITLAVQLKMEAMEPHREAVRKALALQAMPFYCTHAIKSLYATVDAMWYAIGDTSTDFNFYTKRLTLAGVFSATLLFWLDDQSPGHVLTQEFLARRIEGVMQFEKLKAKVKQGFSSTISQKFRARRFG
ncbi:MAG: COQ9 family protein [Rickettsiales bacterium]|nr:COQ9 family protein [Rickettsiales bacterium]